MGREADGRANGSADWQATRQTVKADGGTDAERAAVGREADGHADWQKTKERVQGGGGTDVEKGAVGRQKTGRPSTSLAEKGVCEICGAKGTIGSICQPKVDGAFQNGHGKFKALPKSVK